MGVAHNIDPSVNPVIAGDAFCSLHRLQLPEDRELLSRMVP